MEQFDAEDAPGDLDETELGRRHRYGRIYPERRAKKARGTEKNAANAIERG